MFLSICPSTQYVAFKPFGCHSSSVIRVHVQFNLMTSDDVKQFRVV